MSAGPEGPAIQGDSESAIAQQISQQEQQRVEAYLKRDIAVLDRLLPEDFTFTSSLGFYFEKTELLDAVESGGLVFESFDRHIENIGVHLNTAVATGHDIAKGKYQGREFDGRFRFSNNYVERDGRWQIMVTHVTRLTEQEPSEAEPPTDMKHAV